MRVSSLDIFGRATIYPHLLSDLYHGPPEVPGLSAMTLVTHVMVDGELHHKHLLQDGSTQHLIVM